MKAGDLNRLAINKMVKYFVAVSFSNKDKKYGLVLPYDTSDKGHIKEIEDEVGSRVKAGRLKIIYEGSDRVRAKKSIS